MNKFHDSYFFISKHIQALNSVSNRSVSTYFIDCKLLDGEPNFTFELKEGWSDIRVGQVLFEKEGLNKLLDK